MTGSQGTGSVERLCRAAEVSRASYYRHWRAQAPRREEMGLKDAVQRLALANRRYGYRRIAALLRREGWQAHRNLLYGVLRRPLEPKQYTCGDYVARLAAGDIQPSMSRVANPYDNAKAERFMRTLKEEEVDAGDYRDVADARAGIGTIIETVYNRQRLHSALDYLSPEDYEATLPSLRHGRARGATASLNPTCP